MDIPTGIEPLWTCPTPARTAAIDRPLCATRPARRLDAADRHGMMWLSFMTLRGTLIRGRLCLRWPGPYLEDLG